jgi:hypothetical protein
MREQLWGLVPLAIEAVRYSLQVKKDAGIAIKILRDLGIPPHKSSVPELPRRVTLQKSENPQVRAIRDLLTERMKVYTERDSGVE